MNFRYLNRQARLSFPNAAVLSRTRVDNTWECVESAPGQSRHFGRRPVASIVSRKPITWRSGEFKRQLYAILAEAVQNAH
jgi:hypothetical protein